MPTVSRRLMTVQVCGWLDGAPYLVQVTEDEGNSVWGSDRVTVLLRQNVGDTVLATPVGPAYTVSGADIRSVLVLLLSKTLVTSMPGEIPELVPPRPRGIVW